MKTMNQMIAEYNVLRKQADALKEAMDELKVAMKAQMTLGDKIVVDGTKVSWTATERHTIDAKALRSMYPQVAGVVERVSTVETFKVGG